MSESAEPAERDSNDAAVSLRGASGPSSYRGLVPAIFTLYFVFGTAYSLIFPMWQVTDEISHYINARHHARSDEPIPRYINEQAHQPSAYYRLASLPLMALEARDPTWVAVRHPAAEPYGSDFRFDWKSPNYRFLVGPQLLRWLNVCIGLLTLWFVYHGVRVFVPGREDVAVSALALAGLLPAFIHRNMLISNDGLANLAGAILFYLLGRICVERPEGRWVALALASGAAFTFFIKLTLLPMAAAVALRVLLLFQFLSRRRRVILVAVAVVALLALGTWMVTSKSHAVQDLWRSALARATHVRLEKDSLFDHAIYPLFRKFWQVIAGFDWLTGLVVPLLSMMGGALAFVALATRGIASAHRSLVVVVLLAAVGLGVIANSWAANLVLIGLAAALFVAVRYQQVTGRMPGQLLGSPLGWTMIWSMLAIATVIILKNTMASEWAHGRYFYPEIGPIALASVGGWFFFLGERWHRHLPAAVFALMLVCNAMLLAKHVSAFLG